VPEDRLAAAAAELSATAPEQFTARRAELAAAARTAGDRDAAKAIGALRKPTRAAWVVNTLARSDPDAPRKLAELAAALNAAQLAAQGARLRELSAQRWALIDELTAEALAAADVTDPSPSLRDEVTETLSAALSDPGVAADFAAGRLTRAAQWSGFGTADPGAALSPAARASAASTQTSPETAPLTGTPDGSKAPARLRAVREPERRAVREPERRAVREPERAGRRTARRVPSGPAEPAAARETAERERAAREAAERAKRRQEQHDEAERKTAAAATAAAEANASEERLEAEVRDLEERLTQARGELAAARIRARRAEAAERRARQAFSNTFHDHGTLGAPLHSP
jgi:hypothetical protein